jgi:sarcosine oxidase subunit delta
MASAFRCALGLRSWVALFEKPLHNGLEQAVLAAMSFPERHPSPHGAGDVFLIRKLWRNHLFLLKVASNFRAKITRAHDTGRMTVTGRLTAGVWCFLRANQEMRMLLITCPCCGVQGEETEFHAGGEGHIKRLASAENTQEELGEYLFSRANPKGVHAERWWHQFGCGKWFHALRDTRTLEIYGVYDITASEPPAELMAHARQRLATLGLAEKSTN